MKHQFEQQHVIITGGSSGIGLATAVELVQKGAHITIIGRDRPKLAAAKAKIATNLNNSQQKVFTAAADVSKPAEIEEAIATAIDQLGVPQTLIASAGMAYPGYFHQLPRQIFEQTMAVNYFGTLYSIQAVLPAMIQQGRGNIVMIASGAGLIGIYGYSAYSPSKFALRGLAESLRGELRPLGIRVAIVYPPDTNTPQLEQENQTKPAETRAITATAATWQPEAVARVIVQGINRQFIITPGLEMNLLARLHSLIAPALNWYFDRQVNRVKTTEK